MSNLISRQAAIVALDNRMSSLENVDMQIAMGFAKGIIHELPSVTSELKWIPVSERYPTDINKCYLVCYKDGCITIEYLYFDDDGYPFFSEMELGVVAWMPLPEPYKERGQE